MNEAFRFLGNVPLYDVKMTVVSTIDSTRVDVPARSFGDNAIAPSYLVLPTDADCTLEIVFTQTHGNSHGRTATVLDPKYHKSKDLSWWVVLGSLATDELLATKRVSLSGKTASTTVEFVTSAESIVDNLCLFVVSDCLLGVDMRFTFTIQT